MKSISKNKIIRTITRYKGKDGKPNSHEIEFMTFSKYDAKSEYKFIDGNIEIYPYKWYDLRKIYQIPSYWFLRLINKVRKEQPELESEIINHFNSINVDYLPDWAEIEKQLIEQQAKESQ